MGLWSYFSFWQPVCGRLWIQCQISHRLIHGNVLITIFSLPSLKASPCLICLADLADGLAEWKQVEGP